MLQGLILFHSTPNADTDAKKEDRRREIELIRSDKKELIASLFAPKGFAEANRKRLRGRIEQLQELISSTDDDGIVALLNGMIGRNDMNDMLHGLKVPQLFIFGRMDEFIPVERAEALGRRSSAGRSGVARSFGTHGLFRRTRGRRGNHSRIYRQARGLVNVSGAAARYGE